MRASGIRFYSFIREVAYAGISPARRLHFHRRLAETLIAYGEGAPAETAYHFDRAGDVPQAIGQYRLAGEEAVRLCANRRAIHLLELALLLLGESTPGPEREATELCLLSTLGVAAVAVDGYGAPKVTEIYTRAHALANRADGRLRAPVAPRTIPSARSAGRVDSADLRGNELLELADQITDRVIETEAH